MMDMERNIPRGRSHPARADGCLRWPAAENDMMVMDGWIARLAWFIWVVSMMRTTNSVRYMSVEELIDLFYMPDHPCCRCWSGGPGLWQANEAGCSATSPLHRCSAHMHAESLTHYASHAITCLSSYGPLLSARDVLSCTNEEIVISVGMHSIHYIQAAVVRRRGPSKLS